MSKTSFVFLALLAFSMASLQGLASNTTNIEDFLLGFADYFNMSGPGDELVVCIKTDAPEAFDDLNATINDLKNHNYTGAIDELLAFFNEIESLKGQCEDGVVPFLNFFGPALDAFKNDKKEFDKTVLKDLVSNGTNTVKVGIELDVDLKQDNYGPAGGDFGELVSIALWPYLNYSANTTGNLEYFALRRFSLKNLIRNFLAHEIEGLLETEYETAYETSEVEVLIGEEETSEEETAEEETEEEEKTEEEEEEETKEEEEETNGESEEEDAIAFFEGFSDAFGLQDACKALIQCTVTDPSNLIKNVEGLIEDLEESNWLGALGEAVDMLNDIQDLVSVCPAGAQPYINEFSPFITAWNNNNQEVIGEITDNLKDNLGPVLGDVGTMIQDFSDSNFEGAGEDFGDLVNIALKGIIPNWVNIY